jgi:FkbM family methyltransferase
VTNRLAKATWRAIRPSINRLGFDIVPSGRYEFAQHLTRLGINLAFDVGANTGQFGELLRKSGYRGRIISFEPVLSAYETLKRKASSDREWTALRTAVGQSSDTVDIFINDAHTTMSSILAIDNRFLRDHSWAKPNRSEPVEVITLDAVWSSHARSSDRILLKIDTQGSEDQVLKGVEKEMAFITAIQIELSTTDRMYLGGRLIGDQVAFLESRGFRMIDMASVFRDKEERLLQIDGFFERC